LSRMNCQTFSITFSSGHFGGSGSRVTLSGTATSPENHGAQLSAQRLHRDRDAELLPQPFAEIAQPSAHHAVDRRDQSICAASALPCASVSSSVGPGALRSISPAGPSTLNRTTQPRTICLRVRATFVDHCHGQQTPGLGCVPAPPRHAPQLGGTEVGTQSNGALHGEPPMLPARLPWRSDGITQGVN